jgi:DNA-binding response OmpR family regulator
MFVKRILLVDNDSSFLNILQMYLSACRHVVDIARDGQVALTKLGQNSFDAVLISFNLPDVNGVEVLRRVRQDQPSLPIIMMASTPLVEPTVEELAALGAEVCLCKPFPPQDLEQILRFV